MNTGYSIDITTYNRLIAHADKTIKELKEEIKIMELLTKQLKSQDGKQITKRILPKISLEGYRFDISRRYDRIYLYVFNHDFRKDISLAEYQSNKLNIEYMKKNLDDKKKDLENNLINQEKITELVSIYNAALKYYKQAEENLRTIPGFYSFNRYY